MSVDGGPERKAALRLISRREAELSLDGDTRAYSFAPVYTGTVTPDWNDPQPGAPTELFLGNERLVLPPRGAHPRDPAGPGARGD